LYLINLTTKLLQKNLINLTTKLLQKNLTNTSFPVVMAF